MSVVKHNRRAIAKPPPAIKSCSHMTMCVAGSIALQVAGGLGVLSVWNGAFMAVKAPTQVWVVDASVGVSAGVCVRAGMCIVL